MWLMLSKEYNSASINNELPKCKSLGRTLGTFYKGKNQVQSRHITCFRLYNVLEGQNYRDNKHLWWPIVQGDEGKNESVDLNGFKAEKLFCMIPYSLRDGATHASKLAKLVHTSIKS